jgi:hypothetical protein
MALAKNNRKYKARKKWTQAHMDQEMLKLYALTYFRR